MHWNIEADIFVNLVFFYKNKNKICIFVWK